MKIDLVCKNYEASKKLVEILEKKLNKLSRYFDEGSKVNAVFKSENGKYVLEITVKSKSDVVRTESVSDNMYDNIDIALPRLERQIIKLRTRREDKKKTGGLPKSYDDLVYNVEIPADREPKLVKTKQFALSPMSVEDAITSLDLVGHDFYVFLNERSKAVNVVYKRNDGEIGLIETMI